MSALERRVLAALRPVDATTGAPIAAAIRARAAGARLIRNPRGLLVIEHADGLEAHARSFEAPPAAPDQGSMPLSVDLVSEDGAYAPRRFTLRLPRDPAGLLFRPLDVPMLPSCAAVARASWAVVRATVADGRGRPLEGALLRLQLDGVTRALGLSDGRGEAQLLVAGLAVATWSEDASPGADVRGRDFAATLDAAVDPSALDAQGRALRPADPDALLAALPALPGARATLRVASGSRQHITIVIHLE